MERANDIYYGDMMKESQAGKSGMDIFMENEKDNGLLSKDFIDRLAAERELDTMRKAMTCDMRVPTKSEAEELLKPFGVEIVGSNYGWTFSETCIRLPNSKMVYRSPENVYSACCLRSNLYKLREVKAMQSEDERKAMYNTYEMKGHCLHGSPIYSENTMISSFCAECNTELSVLKSLPHI